MRCPWGEEAIGFSARRSGAEAGRGYGEIIGVFAGVHHSMFNIGMADMFGMFRELAVD